MGIAMPVPIALAYGGRFTALVNVIYVDGLGNVLYSGVIPCEEGKNTLSAPRQYNGCSLTSSEEKDVYVKNGAPTPDSVLFRYARPAGGGSSGSSSAGVRSLVFPAGWDTQFKPSTATAVCEGKISNEGRYANLYNLADNDPSTTFWWLIWRSERTDNVPEITAFFHGDTIGAVAVRPGNLTSSSAYYRYARPCRFRLRLYLTSGGATDTWISFPDRYSLDYAVCSLPCGPIANVSRVEFFLDGGANEAFYTGSEETYYIHVADIQFYNR